jgi:hypothetical protein
MGTKIVLFGELSSDLMKQKTKANSSFGRISFQFSAAKYWNELQKSLKLDTQISLSNFKHQLSE